MFSNKEEVECPVCREKAKITHKWVLNNYGKRYYYVLYHHQGFIHYSNQDTRNSKEFRKGQLEKILIETINSQDFKLGSFRINDIRKLLAKDYPEVGFSSIKVSLNRLAEVGIIEKQKKGRNLLYVNTVSKERLSFIMDSLAVALEDENNDGMFSKHVFLYKIRNDHSWPMFYMPFRVVGDVDATFEDLHMKVRDPSSFKDINLMTIEDSPNDKRVLLRLPSPLLPNETREIAIEYHWPEPKQLFVYSSATKMNNFEFSISANNSTKLTVTLTSASRNETLDLSKGVNESSSEKWKFISSLKLNDVEPFSVLQLRWKQN